MFRSIRHLLAAGLVALPLCALAQTTAPTTVPATEPSPSATQAGPATTESADAMPASSAGSRILHTFDFEEVGQGNYENVPMFWSKVVGDGFPAYASGRFDNALYRSAKTSFRLDIDSGSAAWRFVAPEGKRITINPSADYYIFGYVRTTPLQSARAEIGAWFADEKGEVLPSTEAHSDRYAAGNGEESDDWHVLRLYIPGPKPGSPEAAHAKSLVLQLGLLQPREFLGAGKAADEGLGRFALYQQDIKGTAWFDDIVVFQLPRVSIEVPPEITANIFGPKQNVDLDLTVSDLTRKSKPGGSDLGVTLKITDGDGLVFALEKWTAHTSAAQAWTHHFSHGPLPPALYTATLDVTDGNMKTIIASRETKFLCLADIPVDTNAAGTELMAPRFGLTATQWPVEAWGDLPAIVRHTTAGLLQIPAWRKEMSDSALRTQDPAFDTLVNTLQRLDAHVLATFSEMPRALSDKISASKKGLASQPGVASIGGSTVPVRSDQLLALADANSSLWRPYASFLMARYSNFVEAWEVGSPATPFSGSVSDAHIDAAENRYPDLYARMYKELSGLMNKPRLVIPWNALFDFDSKSYPHSVVDLCIPEVIKPGQIPSYVQNFEELTHPAAKGGSAHPANQGPPDTEMYIHIDPLPAGTYSRTDRLADFAQRLIYARAANPAAVLTDLPLTRTLPASSGTVHSEPDELLLVYRTIVRALGGSTYRREIPISPGVRAFLFIRTDAEGNLPPNEAGREGILAVWNESAPVAAVEADLPLGGVPRLIKLNGLSKQLAVDPATHMTHITATNAPLIVTFVDAHLLELRSSFALSNANIPAGAGMMQTEVKLSNPYNEPLSATLRMNPPAGWTIDPPSIVVSIPPGGTFTQRVTIRYPYTEIAGANQIGASLVADGDGPGGKGHPLQLSFPVSIKSDAVDTEGFARLMPNGDLVVQQMITNISQTPLNAEAYALVPGYARQQHFVVNLAPGQTTIKRFVFPMASNVNYTKTMTATDVSNLFTNKTASVGLRQSNGKTLITKSFSLN